MKKITQSQQLSASHTSKTLCQKCCCLVEVLQKLDKSLFLFFPCLQWAVLIPCFTPLRRSVSLWGGDLLACEPREFPDAFGYGILGEERSGWCVPHICTNTAVEESGNATCRRKPAFRPVGTDSYRSKFCWLAVYGSPWYTAPCPSLLLVPWTLHGAAVPTSCWGQCRLARKDVPIHISTQKLFFPYF